jgi:hypothetical protein
MLRDRINANSITRRTVIGYSGVVTVTGNPYPSDLAYTGESNTPDLVDIELTSDSSLSPDTAYTGTFNWVTGPHEYGHDGVFSYMRCADFFHGKYFKVAHRTLTDLNLTTMYTRYCVYFEDSFFDGITEGGLKMPGGMVNTAADPLFAPPDDWSNRTWVRKAQARLGREMFLRDYPGNVNANPDTQNVGSTGFQPNRWYSVELRCTRNTIGQADGISQAWINGNEVFNITNIEWTTESDSVMMEWLVEVFHGGTNRVMNPPGYVRLAKIGYSTSYIGVPSELFEE